MLYPDSPYLRKYDYLFTRNKRLYTTNQTTIALEIRSIPVLEGAAAERFIREAEENARNPKKSGPRILTLADFEQIEANTLARERARRHG